MEAACSSEMSVNFYWTIQDDVALLMVSASIVPFGSSNCTYYLLQKVVPSDHAYSFLSITWQYKFIKRGVSDDPSVKCQSAALGYTHYPTIELSLKT
jgi:hypothetical protein